ncbi:MAG: hypothetical protein RBS28_13265 [Rhodocyclaceae bacterium]|jgi:hypothetical protein|nr:hypothetical protein [Rhodocyclaceae bacterium]
MTVKQLLMRLAGMVMLSALPPVWSMGAVPQLVQKDSGVSVATLYTGYPAIFWLDNTQVVFLGFDGKTYRLSESGVKRPMFRVHTWNTETGEITVGAEASKMLCVHAGRIKYATYVLKGGRYAEEEMQWFAGNIGEEREADRALEGLTASDWETHWPTCQQVKQMPPLPTWTEGRSIKRLLPEHGFLDLGVLRGQEDEVKYYPLGAGKDEGIVMPFKKGRFSTVTIRFFPFKNAYLIESSHWAYVKPWPVDFPTKRLWWLHPDGRVEEYAVPHHTSYQFYYASNKGWVFKSNDTSREKVGEAGLYLVQGEQITRLVSAVVSNPAVSPDGCRIAYRHDPHDGSTGYDLISRITLRMIDLCEGGN